MDYQIIFAPNYTSGNPYQILLASALRALGLPVHFLNEYRRGLPLWRGLRRVGKAILHLHWPEHYFRYGGSVHRQIRRGRYPLDLVLATNVHPLVVTAHNLKTHGIESLIDPLIKFTYHRAHTVIAHSGEAKKFIAMAANLPPDRIRVIPHGDLLEALPGLPPQAESRAKLGLRSDHKYALMFGRIEPYKGIDEVVEYWKSVRPATHLIIAGDSSNQEYVTELKNRIIMPLNNVTLMPKELTDLELSELLSAVDCALFNYSSILTSGSAVLARSAGIPVLLPERLSTIDLGEPSSLVFRFRQLDQEFAQLLRRAVNTSGNFDEVNAWRQTTRWSAIAEQTSGIYQEIAQREAWI
jgi:glycosyltransferase involved in cell wall biosynthesis